jgi:hypothetical protein
VGGRPERPASDSATRVGGLLPTSAIGFPPVEAQGRTEADGGPTTVRRGRQPDDQPCIGGSLKRTVEETKKRTDEQEKKTAELERFVVGQFMSMSNTQTVNVNLVTSQELKQARDEVPPPPETVAQDEGALSPIDPQRAVKLTQILDLYEQMATIFATVTGERRHRFLDPSGRLLIDHPKLLAWYREYKEPFDTFRAARSTAAHNPGSLSDEDLQTALELGQRLMFTLRDAVRGIMPTDDS